MPFTKVQLSTIVGYVQLETQLFSESPFNEKEQTNAERFFMLERYIKNDFRADEQIDFGEIQAIDRAIHDISQIHKIPVVTKDELEAAQRIAKLEMISTLENLGFSTDFLKSKKRLLIQEVNKDIENHRCLNINAYALERNLDSYINASLNESIQHLMAALGQTKTHYSERLETFESLITIMRQKNYHDLVPDNASKMREIHTQLSLEYQKLPSRFRQMLHPYQPVLRLWPYFIVATIPTLALVFVSYFISSAIYEFQNNPEAQAKLAADIANAHKNGAWEELRLLKKYEVIVTHPAMQFIFAYFIPIISGLASSVNSLTILLGIAGGLYGIHYWRGSSERAPTPLPEIFLESDQADLRPSLAVVIGT